MERTENNNNNNNNNNVNIDSNVNTNTNIALIPPSTGSITAESQYNKPTDTITKNGDDASNRDEMSIWLEKVNNISKNNPDWMDMSSDAMVATVFAIQELLQSLTRDSLLLASYRHNQLNNSHNGLLQHSISSSSQQQIKDLVLNYNDIADCVSIKEQYAILSDMIPRTKYLKDLVRENKIRYTTFINSDQLPSSDNIIQIDVNNDNDTEDEQEH